MNIALAAKLLGGDVVGRDRVLAPGPGHTPKDRSLSVIFSGSSFAVFSFAGDDWKSCRDHVATVLGLGSSFQHVRPSSGVMEKISQGEADRSRRRETRALACWNEARSIHGTIAEAYLRGRGITCELPDTLRFHPSCWHPKSMSLPAMVAMVEGSERFAIHRTYLCLSGDGKADISPAKAMLGTVAGGAVRLSVGGDKLVVCEGIETGLSLLSGLLRGPATVWAALSTSGMKRLTLPSEVSRLTIATDGDDAGRTAGNALATKATIAGWSVSLLPAPNGADWNNIVMKGSVA